MSTVPTNRRSFLKTAGAVATAGAAWAQGTPETQTKKMIGIQIGAVSFVDEGVEQVLDVVQQRAHVNTLFLVTFAYNNGLAGRQVPGYPLPDHGKQEYDHNFQGGYYATLHPQYYKDTSFKAARAPDQGDFDLLASVLPSAKKRGLKTIAFMADNFRRNLPNAENLLERDLDGQVIEGVCWNNPEYRAFALGMVEDCLRSYELDGLLWRSERAGVLSRLLAYHQGASGAGCFCEFCQRKARQQGINVERARQGCRALEAFVRSSRAGKRPVDGHFVTFWRLLLRYPEIAAWEMFWVDSLRETYQAVYKKVKSIRGGLPVGWAIAHSNCISPLYRAEQDLQELGKYSDFLKIVMYHNVIGPRMINYLDQAGSAWLADLPKPQLLEFEYRIMNYQERPYDQIERTGFSSDFVHREARRAMEGAAGTQTQIWPGIDIDLPTKGQQAQCTPQGTKAAVLAAFRAGVHGVILARKYSEMRLANLSGAGEAMRELGLA